MPSTNLCFLWHMHQPLYKDVAHGEYRLPWTRLHALKDYFGMVKVLDDFPSIHQTFNLVPSLFLQLEEYAAGRASDPFLKLALKPAEDLDRGEKECMLQYFFEAPEEHALGRYPRYAELHEWKRRHQYSGGETAASFTMPMLLDLQVLSQLAWFDELYREHDSAIQQLMRKGREYTREDQAIVGQKQGEALASVLEGYRAAARRGQIEISTSPMYHPILPLLCDTNVAAVAHPYMALPTRFCAPQDAEAQLLEARAYINRLFDVDVAGLWPPEGAVSDQTLALTAKCGYRWTATCQRVLARTLEASTHNGEDAAGNLQTQGFLPYVWKQDDRSIDVLFRDDRLSDLIGFVYSRMDPAEAAAHFVNEVHARAAAARAGSDRDVLITVVLDGENTWDTYTQNGRPFLRELYTRLASDPSIQARTVQQALAGTTREHIDHIVPGSWTDGNFDTWIGGTEHNLAWEHLRRAKEMFETLTRRPDAQTKFTQQAIAAARESLLVAEGSDWFWWYNPENSSPHQSEYDQLFRERLQNVYRALDQLPPPQLSQPISRNIESSSQQHPKGLIQPVLDGIVTSASEWGDAGRYRGMVRSGAMHRPVAFARDVFYGSDGRNMFFRVDVAESVDPETELQFRFAIRTPAGDSFNLSVAGKPFRNAVIETDVPGESVDAAIGAVCEAKVSLSAMHVRLGDPLYVQVHVFRDGLPVAAIPTQGEMVLGAGVMAAYAY